MSKEYQEPAFKSINKKKMDLDHTKLGHNCEVADCNQRDFLPFTCDLCRRKLCLLHRSYNAHSCEGSNSKDMTSIDCPICGKSVKFSQSQSADAIWDNHYNTICSRQFSKTETAKTCFKTSCSTVLGLSNSFTCLKCQKVVCLTHRNPEEHDCVSLKGNIKDYRSSFLDRFDSRNYMSSEPTSNPASRNIPKKKPEPSLQTMRSLRNNSDIRADNNSSVLTELSCPMCAFKTRDAGTLEAHFNSSHTDSFETSTATTSSGSFVDLTVEVRTSQLISYSNIIQNNYPCIYQVTI